MGMGRRGYCMVGAGFAIATMQAFETPKSRKHAASNPHTNTKSYTFLLATLSMLVPPST
jgi:hypothetical protein